MKPPAFLVAAVAALMPLATQAQTQAQSETQAPDSSPSVLQDVRATVGVRMWRTTWQSWFGDGTQYLQSGGENTVIPVVGLRYKDFLLSGSYLLEKKFQFGQGSSTTDANRKEYDVNVGYFLLPGLAATLGYKEIQYVGAGDYEWRAKGFTLGLSGSAPLAPSTSLYGNVALGRPELNDDFAFNKQRGKYLLTEFGLAFPLGHWNSSMNGFVVTAGYRYQRVGAYSNSSFATLTHTSELYETTQGPVIGASYSF
jgi:hypothetical protein